MAAKPVYAVGLDAASGDTRLVICVLEGGRLRFLGRGVAKSRGWLKGRIADQGAVANSILQGSLIIDEAEFVKRFPGESGYRMFLVDAPPKEAAGIAAMLGIAMPGWGQPWNVTVNVPPAPQTGTLTVCSRCGHTNPQGARFCSGCGAAL